MSRNEWCIDGISHGFERLAQCVIKISGSGGSHIERGEISRWLQPLSHSTLTRPRPVVEITLNNDVPGLWESEVVRLSECEVANNLGWIINIQHIQCANAYLIRMPQ